MVPWVISPIYSKDPLEGKSASSIFKYWLDIKKQFVKGPTIDLKMSSRGITKVQSFILKKVIPAAGNFLRIKFNDIQKILFKVLSRFGQKKILWCPTYVKELEIGLFFAPHSVPSFYEPSSKEQASFTPYGLTWTKSTRTAVCQRITSRHGCSTAVERTSRNLEV